MGRYPPLATFIRLFLVLVIFCSNGAALSAPSVFAHWRENQIPTVARSAIVPPKTPLAPARPIYDLPTGSSTPRSTKAQAWAYACASAQAMRACSVPPTLYFAGLSARKITIRETPAALARLAFEKPAWAMRVSKERRQHEAS